MAVSEQQVRRIAELARLRPDDAALERLTGEMNRILEHVRVLEELDVEGLKETVDAVTRPISYRDGSLAPDPLTGGAPGDRAPDWRDGFFVVPRLPALDGGAREKPAGARDERSGGVDEGDPRSSEGTDAVEEAGR